MLLTARKIILKKFPTYVLYSEQNMCCLYDAWISPIVEYFVESKG